MGNKKKYSGLALEMEPSDAVQHMENAIADIKNFCEGSIFGEIDGKLILVLYTEEKGYIYTIFDKERILHMQTAIDHIMKEYFS